MHKYEPFFWEVCLVSILLGKNLSDIFSKSSSDDEEDSVSRNKTLVNWTLFSTVIVERHEATCSTKSSEVPVQKQQLFNMVSNPFKSLPLDMFVL